MRGVAHAAEPAVRLDAAVRAVRAREVAEPAAAGARVVGKAALELEHLAAVDVRRQLARTAVTAVIPREARADGARRTRAADERERDRSAHQKLPATATPFGATTTSTGRSRVVSANRTTPAIANATPIPPATSAIMRR